MQTILYLVLLMQYNNYLLHSVLTYASSNVCCAVIDFSKAFDSVDRHILHSRLMEYGISNIMLTVIIKMYRNMKCKVNTDSGCSTYFTQNNAVMPGECLSPTLFALYRYNRKI